MESLLLERLEKEVSYLAAIQSALEGGVNDIYNSHETIIYAKGRMDELKYIIDLIKRLEQK